MKITQVVAAIIIKNKKYFIAKRPKGKHLEDKFEFPGGKLLANETHEEGLKREIREENFRDNFVNVNLHYYICSHKIGKIDLKEHQESAWVTKEEFKFYEFAEGDKDFISLL